MSTVTHSHRPGLEVRQRERWEDFGAGEANEGTAPYANPDSTQDHSAVALRGQPLRCLGGLEASDDKRN